MKATDFLKPREVFRRAQDAMHQMVDVTKTMSRMATQPLTVSERVLKSQEQTAQMMSTLAQAWSDFAKNGLGPDALSFEGFGPDAFRAALEKNPLADFLNSPGFGLLREMGADVGSLQEAWLDVVKHQLEYQAMLSQAWSNAFAQLFKRLSEEALEHKSAPEPEHVMRLWVELADEAFIDIFKTEEFSSAQAAYLNANLRLRGRQRRMLEDTLRAADLPTRSDLDEAHRAIYALRKELKALRKAQAAQ